MCTIYSLFLLISWISLSLSLLIQKPTKYYPIENSDLGLPINELVIAEKFLDTAIVNAPVIVENNFLILKNYQVECPDGFQIPIKENETLSLNDHLLSCDTNLSCSFVIWNTLEATHCSANKYTNVSQNVGFSVFIKTLKLNIPTNTQLSISYNTQGICETEDIIDVYYDILSISMAIDLCSNNKKCASFTFNIPQRFGAVPIPPNTLYLCSTKGDIISTVMSGWIYGEKKA